MFFAKKTSISSVFGFLPLRELTGRGVQVHQGGLGQGSLPLQVVKSVEIFHFDYKKHFNGLISRILRNKQETNTQ